MSVLKKSIVATIALSLFVAFVPSSIASAHVLKLDGTIGAVLHINPDDNPVSEQSTNYVLSFEDTSHRFSLSRCLCNVDIVKDTTTLTTQPLVMTSDSISENNYVFPDAGVYTLRITGAPKEANQFQPFSLKYTVRVSGDNASTHHDFPPLLWAGIGLAMGLVLLSTVPALYTDSITMNSPKGKK